MNEQAIQLTDNGGTRLPFKVELRVVADQEGTDTRIESFSAPCGFLPEDGCQTGAKTAAVAEKAQLDALRRTGFCAPRGYLA